MEIRQGASERLPDWQLPTGVDRALWEYLSDDAIADDYDDYFAHTHLLQLDREFLDRHFQRPGRLADLGCGSGRLLLHFAQRGFDVVGVDLSEAMLRVCRQKGEKLGRPIELVHANLCEMPEISSTSCDYALCMFSTLGMIVGVENRRQALREIARILRPGGLLGMHVHNRWFNLFDPQGRRWLARDLIRQVTGSPGAGDKVQVRYRGIPNLRLHLFSAREIRRELSAAGFCIRQLLPLAPDRTGGLYFPQFLSGIRANGWLIVAERSAFESSK